MHTITQAADLLGVTRQRVHYLIKIKRLPATRCGSVWIVDSLRIKPGKPGKPRKDA